jgi:hypothetical protein
MREKIRAIKDNVWIGVAIGLSAPILPGILVWILMQKVTALRNADLLLIACIAINALLMNYFFKLNKENIGKGIISSTFLWAFAFFYYKVLR